MIFGNRVGFSFTGLAEINGVKTDFWLADTLNVPGCRTASDACAAIESRATEAFRQLRGPAWMKRHAFVGVGWVLLAPDERFRPAICVVSNAEDEHGNWLPEAQPRFVTRFYGMADDKRVMLRPTGQRVEPDEKYYLLRNAYKCVSRGLGPESILRLLAFGIRNIAARNVNVGKNLSVLSLPIGAAGSDMYTTVMSLPQPNVPSFCLLPEHMTNFVSDSAWIVNEYFIGQIESLRVE